MNALSPAGTNQTCIYDDWVTSSFAISSRVMEELSDVLPVLLLSFQSRWRMEASFFPQYFQFSPPKIPVAQKLQSQGDYLFKYES